MHVTDYTAHIIRAEHDARIRQTLVHARLLADLRADRRATRAGVGQPSTRRRRGRERSQ